jgi:hypothetical protein
MISSADHMLNGFRNALRQHAFQQLRYRIPEARELAKIFTP